jgi:hypothetical protein
MAETVVRILKVDSRLTVDELRKVEGAMRSVQNTARQTALKTTNMIPIKPIKKAQTAVVSAGGSLGVLNGALASTGIQSQGLSVAFQAAATSAELLKGGTVSMSQAMKGLVKAIGPTGFALLGLAAAVAIVVKVFSRHTQTVEEAEEALKKYNAAAAASAKILNDVLVRGLEREGKLRDAAVLKNLNRIQDNIDAAKKAAQEEHDEEFERAIEHTRNSLSLVERDKIKNDLLAKNRRELNDTIAIITREGRKDEAAINKKFDDAAKAARLAVLDATIDAAEEETKAAIAAVTKEKDAQEQAQSDIEAMINGFEEQGHEDLISIEADKTKAVKDAADARIKIRQIELAQELKDNAETQKELQKQLAATRAANPAFQAQFVSLKGLGRGIQQAAASRAETVPRETLEIQKKIKANAEAAEKIREKQAADALEVQEKMLVELRKKVAARAS